MLHDSIGYSGLRSWRTGFAVALVALLGMVAVAAMGVGVTSNAIAAGEEDEVKLLLEERSNAAVARLKVLQSADDLSRETVLPIMREEMSPLFDWRKLASQAAGKHWRKGTDEEKEQLTAVFRELLERNYANVLSKFSGQEVSITKAKKQEGGKKIVVVAEVSGSGGTAKLEYVFAGMPYKIINIKVEGVGLLSNYRRQFGQVLKKDGFPALISRLEKLASK